MSRDSGYLLDILVAARLALDFVSGLDQAGFERDVKTQDAVLRRLEIIGEATKRLSDETKRQHPDVAWKKMAGMRDFLIHDYDKVNLARVWEVLQENLLPLIAVIEPLIPPDDTDQPAS